MNNVQNQAAQELAGVLSPAFKTGEAIARDLTQILADEGLLADNGGVVSNAQDKAAQALAEVLMPAFKTGEAIARDLVQILADKGLLAE